MNKYDTEIQTTMQKALKDWEDRSRSVKITDLSLGEITKGLVIFAGLGLSFPVALWITVKIAAIMGG